MFLLGGEALSVRVLICCGWRQAVKPVLCSAGGVFWRRIAGCWRRRVSAAAWRICRRHREIIQWHAFVSHRLQRADATTDFLTSILAVLPMTMPYSGDSVLLMMGELFRCLRLI